MRVAAALFLLASVVPLHAQPVTLPRYQFNVGDWLIYERRGEFTRTGDEAAAPQRSFEQLQLWCLTRERDQWLLLLDMTPVVEGAAQPVRGTLLYVDSRGLKTLPEPMRSRVADLDPLFDLIPELQPALATPSGWSTTPDLFGRVLECTPGAAVAGEPAQIAVQFSLGDRSGSAQVLGQSRSGTYVFDRDQGVIRSVESDDRDPAAQTRTRSRIRLIERRSAGGAWLTQRLDEVPRFLRALRNEDRLLDDVLTSPGEIDRTLAALDRLWLEFDTDLSSQPDSPIRRLGRGRRARLGDEAGALRDRARMAARWGGKTAAQWSLQDLSGQTVRSESLRTKLCVECFWASGSEPALRMMQTLRDLKGRLPAEAVNVVCLNIDADPQIARRAAETAGQGLLHVLAGPPVGGPPPRELPVVRVVGKDSRILRIHVGWRASLVEEIAPLIE